MGPVSGGGSASEARKASEGSKRENEGKSGRNVGMDGERRTKEYRME